MTDPSESVTRFKGSVPTGTTRPAGGEQRGPVPQRSRDEASGEERRAGDGGQREQGAFEHGSQYGRSRDSRHPLSLRRDGRSELSSDPAYPLGPGVVPAARRAPGPPGGGHGRSHRAAAGEPGVPQFSARRANGAGRGLP